MLGFSTSSMRLYAALLPWRMRTSTVPAFATLNHSNLRLDVRFLEDLATATPDGVQVSVIPAVAGG